MSDTNQQAITDKEIERVSGIVMKCMGVMALTLGGIGLMVVGSQSFNALISYSWKTTQGIVLQSGSIKSRKDAFDGTSTTGQDVWCRAYPCAA